MPEEPGLIAGDFAEIQRPGDDDRDQDANRPRHLVADHLGRLADAAEQRPLTAGPVHRQDHAEHFARKHGEHEEHGDAEFLADQPVAERQRQERDERPGQRHVRGDPEQEVVGVAGDRVFFAEEFDAVGEGLKPAELAADAGGPEPVLDAAGDFPLQPDEDAGGNEDEPHQDATLRRPKRRRPTARSNVVEQSRRMIRSRTASWDAQVYGRSGR